MGKAVSWAEARRAREGPSARSRRPAPRAAAPRGRAEASGLGFFRGAVVLPRDRGPLPKRRRGMKVALRLACGLSSPRLRGLERHVAAAREIPPPRRVRRDVSTRRRRPRSRDLRRERTVFVPYRMIPWPRRKGFVILDRDTNYLAWSLRAARRVLSDGRPTSFRRTAAPGFGYALLGGSEVPACSSCILTEWRSSKRRARSATLYLPLRSAIRFAARRAARVLAPMPP